MMRISKESSHTNNNMKMKKGRWS